MAATKAVSAAQQCAGSSLQRSRKRLAEVGDLDNCREWCRGGLQGMGKGYFLLQVTPWDCERVNVAIALVSWGVAKRLLDYSRPPFLKLRWVGSSLGLQGPWTLRTELPGRWHRGHTRQGTPWAQCFTMQRTTFAGVSHAPHHRWRRPTSEFHRQGRIGCAALLALAGEWTPWGQNRPATVTHKTANP